MAEVRHHPCYDADEVNYAVDLAREAIRGFTDTCPCKHPDTCKKCLAADKALYYLHDYREPEEPTWECEECGRDCRDADGMASRRCRNSHNRRDD